MLMKQDETNDKAANAADENESENENGQLLKNLVRISTTSKTRQTHCNDHCKMKMNPCHDEEENMIATKKMKTHQASVSHSSCECRPYAS
jgi:hypothetical protein